MKFPYGICDFRKIVTKGYYYCDRTDRIPKLEKHEYALFLRPRRFGKSLLLSMLINYYDLGRKDQFDEIFGKLKIGRNPTSLRNQFLVLEWDFSCIDPMGTAKDIRRVLHDHVNERIKRFIVTYREYLNIEIEIDPNNTINSINSLITSVEESGHPIYLFIDEYDNFANEVMMGVRRESNDLYEALVYEEGPLKTLFKVVKSSTKESVFDRIFITGVSPVVMSDITSGYNIGKNIYQRPMFNDLCGFNEAEIKEIVDDIADECDLKKQDAENALTMMRIYYNGSLFSRDAEKPVYNPTLAFYFLEIFEENCRFPYEMLDDNLATDEAKLRYVAQLPQGRNLLLDMIKDRHETVIGGLAKRFGIQEMLTDQSKDKKFLASFLYYFGVLTNAGETETGDIVLRVPNLVIYGLYIERIIRMLLPEPIERDDGKLAAKQLYQSGDMKSLCKFIETQYFQVFHNADYKWANELTVKTAFLTLLYHDNLYIMDSELEIGRGVADLVMIIRPDMRRFKILDILIEFKYVKLKDAELSGEQAKKLSLEELQKLPLMKSAMDEAKNQLKRYGDALEKKYKNLRLRRYAVVSLGFERLWWKEEV
ncbi:AAA family ATPase [Desulfobacterales bacterium HSG16]|nr:AAA family ATPase [Desulfobacterales bacterium HSG16]